jgi:Pyruvate/2-oxoacid:ferredoxin oxidoreductase delta subunit
MKINITAKPNTSIKNKTGGWRTFKPKTESENSQTNTSKYEEG